MAHAFVRYGEPFGKGAPEKAVIRADCSFSGEDVPSEIDGQTYPLNVETTLDYTLFNVRTDLTTAVRTKALELGLTVSNSTIFLQSFESFGSAGMASPLAFWLGGATAA
jgi:hypothetical protein